MYVRFSKIVTVILFFVSFISCENYQNNIKKQLRIGYAESSVQTEALSLLTQEVLQRNGYKVELKNLQIDQVKLSVDSNCIDFLIIGTDNQNLSELSENCNVYKLSCDIVCVNQQGIMNSDKFIINYFSKLKITNNQLNDIVDIVNSTKKGETMMKWINANINFVQNLINE
jgi:hypothetical protein